MSKQNTELSKQIYAVYFFYFPSHKEGAKSNMNNYGPISVILIIAKAMEERNMEPILFLLATVGYPNQFSTRFRPLHSTITALLKMSNQWYRNMDEDLINRVVFLDLKKAFDISDQGVF